MKYDFGEKAEEYSAKDGAMIPVWKSPKYEQSKKAVIKLLESPEYKDVLDVSDFWILMNRTKSGKMAYTGLIISHNGCLKINDILPDELKFKPQCLSIEYKGENEIRTYNDSLIFIYNSAKLNRFGEIGDDKQQIYEIGEVSSRNCTNDYPYAMALKRCMDRVILKNSKLAYNGVYSDSEAEEFTNNEEKQKEETPDKLDKFIKATDKQLELIKNIYAEKKNDLAKILNAIGKKKIDELSVQEASKIISDSKE